MTLVIDDEMVERACAAYCRDWSDARNWPKFAENIRNSMRNVLSAALSMTAPPTAIGQGHDGRDAKGNTVPKQVWVTHQDIHERIYMHGVSEEPWEDWYDAPITKTASNTRFVPASDFRPGIIHYEDGDFSQLLLEDGPTVTDFQPALVEPLLRMTDRALVGFQWRGVTPPTSSLVSAGWQRWLPDIAVWADVREEDLEHYRAKGSLVRQVFANHDQPQQGD